MPLEVVCKVCKRSYEPSRKDVIAGVWQVCPACRPIATPDDPPTVA
jgi:hypothetical protein